MRTDVDEKLNTEAPLPPPPPVPSAEPQEEEPDGPAMTIEEAKPAQIPSHPKGDSDHGPYGMAPGRQAATGIDELFKKATENTGENPPRSNRSTFGTLGSLRDLLNRSTDEMDRASEGLTMSEQKTAKRRDDLGHAHNNEDEARQRLIDKKLEAIGVYRLVSQRLSDKADEMERSLAEAQINEQKVALSWPSAQPSQEEQQTVSGPLDEKGRPAASTTPA